MKRTQTEYRKKETRYCDQGCGYKLPTEYATDETTCGACLNEYDDYLKGDQHGC